MTSSLTPSATDAFVCPLLKTGQDGCAARFERAQYQLVLIREDNEETLDLGFSGSRVLERLLLVPGEVVSREELMTYAWEGRVVGQGSLNQQIYTLRQALFDGGSQIIQTLPRRGYLFNPQYLIGDQAQPSIEAAPVMVVAEAADTGVIELPLPSPVPMAEQPKPGRRHRSWQTLALAGSGLLILLGLATLGFRLASHSTPSFTQTVEVGALEVLYVEKNQRLLDSLVKETRPLVDTLANMSAEQTRLIVNMSPGFYEIRCLQGDGRVNWLKVHKSQIQTIPNDKLQGCLQ
ncbi:winged helix-turn-helix domain-containing protein [Pseudomonas stutzeri]|uniref:winged helix-turn-helix domain-containing protein n=1 Tax=Stutzerimonas stutzeri TaxID=316 RepID=UPI000C9A99FA|nr:winged helix-turn-helix domain-containing protein [Stutzerimonas stutzeri]MCQ4279432.1 winged helix-turn-helix domain-containing protein [Stutzerimonas stutzeri]PNF72024.1 CadC family transcriptional regulator [Stutzerimonas stutzeri]